MENRDLFLDALGIIGILPSEFMLEVSSRF